jgi:heme-degrading monooxygenase HmoA
MYIAMNRFRVNEGHEAVFEEAWRSRERFLDQVEGFQQFQLLRGATKDGETEFISHSTWRSEEAFRTWTNSEAFRKAHGDARTPKGTLVGHPDFSGYAVLMTEPATPA